MLDLTHITAVLSDPICEALARATAARIGYRHREAVAVLQRPEAILVVLRVGHRPMLSHSNRFIVVKDGLLVWAKPFTGLSDLAYMLKDGGWKVSAPDEADGTANRLAKLMKDGMVPS